MRCGLGPAAAAASAGVCFVVWVIEATARKPSIILSRHPRGYTAAVRPREHLPCTWDVPDEREAADVNSTVATFARQFIAVLETHVRTGLGLEYTLLDGSLLGAVRSRGLIPGDRDVDAVVLLPRGVQNESEGAQLVQLHAALQHRLEASASPFQVELSDDGRTRWLRLVPWVQQATDGRPFAGDLLVYASSHLSQSTWAGVAFSGLCRCRFPDQRTGAWCFEEAPRYLRHVYSEPRLPSDEHAARNFLDDAAPAPTRMAPLRPDADVRPDTGAPGLRPAVAAKGGSGGAPGWCVRMKRRAQVVPGASWGRLTERQQAEWKARRCDLVFCEPSSMEAKGTYRCIPRTAPRL